MILGLLLSATLSSLAISPTPEAVRTRAREILDDADVQTELPDGSAKATGKGRTGKRRHSAGRSRRPRESSNTHYRSPMSNGLFYVALAVAVALALVWFMRAMSDHRADTQLSESQDEEDAPVARVAVDQLRVDAEALARQGNYAQAIHVLLLRTFSELKKKRKRVLADSLTSREVLARATLPDDARESLSGLVSTVEVSFFGDQKPDRTTYEQCLQHFDRFAESYAQGAS